VPVSSVLLFARHNTYWYDLERPSAGPGAHTARLSAVLIGRLFRGPLTGCGAAASVADKLAILSGTRSLSLWQWAPRATTNTVVVV
jgi:hypothetical protein